MTDESDEIDYEPAVVTAGKDCGINIKFYDTRTTESEHVSMPDHDE